MLARAGVMVHLPHGPGKDRRHHCGFGFIKFLAHLYILAGVIPFFAFLIALGGLHELALRCPLFKEDAYRLELMMSTTGFVSFRTQ